MKEYYEQEFLKTAADIAQNKEDADLCFALLTDTRLSETSAHTATNIQTVDRQIGFDCLVHLGDLLEGKTSKWASEQLLDWELTKYRESIRAQKLFVVPGERDGYRDEGFTGQLVYNIYTDDFWYKHTKFLTQYAHLDRPGNKPYYYVDFPEKQVRMIFLFPFTWSILEGEKLYEKYPVFDLQQLAWLKNTALAAPDGYTILLFSHLLPKSRFDTGKDPFIYKGNSTEAVLAILQQANKRLNIAAWIAGHYNCDAQIHVGGIPFVVISSQLFCKETLAKCSDVTCITERPSHTPSQDLWDAVVLNTKARTLKFFRFGAGADRCIAY